jgi:uncharacterized protein (TIGR00251 family)
MRAAEAARPLLPNVLDCQSMDDLELLAHNDAIGLRVRVKPRSSRSAVVGVEQGALVVALAAAPHDGEANQELVRLLARLAKVHTSQVRLAAGASGRHKLIRIRGVGISELRTTLLEQL